AEERFESWPQTRSCPNTGVTPNQQGIYPMLLLGQLLLGIGAVPIQPFGISYIDDYASKKNSPLYLGILLAVTSIGPAFGFITGSLMLRIYVDFDKLLPEDIQLDLKDLRWVGAWWLGFLVASCLLFLTALPYLFFPRNMPKEVSQSNLIKSLEGILVWSKKMTLTTEFPEIALRMLRNPMYMLVVLALVNLAALLSGLATFMAKFIEKQFSQPVSFSTMMIGGVGIPMGVLGTVLGGVLMRRFSLSVNGASKLCTTAIFLCMLSALPLLFIGCPTQDVAGYAEGSEVANSVNYTECRCVGGLHFARPGTCGSGCQHLLLPFMVLLGLTAFIASFSQTPSCVMILREVPPEDKSFAVGVQYMLFRVLAFMPGPVLYGSVIDTTCILWGKKCGKETSCHYYDLNRFRNRFLGLQVVFVCGALLCYLLTVVVLRKRDKNQEEYQMVNNLNRPENTKEKELLT
uniref:Solute carrier organic anion transporter family, member 2B1 n=1 Tax=Amphilophus citrinellus TaxID=61819 RepID=A0A3Q0QXQ7_AMPCI